MMRVAHLTSSISRKGSGLAEAIRGMTGALREAGVEVCIFALDDKGTIQEPDRPDGEVRTFRTRGPAVFGYAPGLVEALCTSRAEVLHLQGLWRYTSVACRCWRRQTGQPYIVSPHGMVNASALRQSAWKKRLALLTYEGRNLMEAACLHALSLAEAAALRRLGLENPIAVIPNGVDLPAGRQTGNPDWAEGMPAEEKVVLYLGRLHPVKGLKELIQAWSAVEGEAKEYGWRLVICGWGDNGYESQIRQLAHRLKVTGRVHFTGPRFGPSKEATLARASAFVLPSRGEGLPMAVMEAWSWGLPVIMTAECNLAQGFECGAALRVEARPESIAEGLNKLFRMPEAERRRAGEAGQRLVRERYCRRTIAAQMRQVYEWVAGNGPAPESILA